jgi:hypothetical protein
VALVSVKKRTSSYDPIFDRFAIETVRAQPRERLAGLSEARFEGRGGGCTDAANCKSVIAGQNAPARAYRMTAATTP